MKKSVKRQYSAAFGVVVALTALLLLFSVSTGSVSAQADPTTQQAPPDGQPPGNPPDGSAPSGAMDASGTTAIPS